MSLPPALLNLVDQAKDALWALTACIFHPSAKVKVNGRTCACSPRPLSRSTPLVFLILLYLLRPGSPGRTIVLVVLDCSQDPEGAWRRRIFVRLFMSRRNQRCQFRASAFIMLPGGDTDYGFSEGVCLEENPVPDWFRRCKAGHEGSGGLQEVQVRRFLRFYVPEALIKARAVI